MILHRLFNKTSEDSHPLNDNLVVFLKTTCIIQTTEDEEEITVWTNS